MNARIEGMSHMKLEAGFSKAYGTPSCSHALNSRSDTCNSALPSRTILLISRVLYRQATNMVLTTDRARTQTIMFTCTSKRSARNTNPQTSNMTSLNQMKKCVPDMNMQNILPGVNANIDWKRQQAFLEKAFGDTCCTCKQLQAKLRRHRPHRKNFRPS